MALVDNLISYWSLDGDSLDAHGANDGSDTAVSYGTGKLGSAAGGNGTTSQIDVGSANLNLTGDMTISAWIKKASDGYWFIVTRCNPSIGTYEFRTEPSGQIAFLCNGGSASGGSLSNGAWHHVVGVRDGTNHKVYLNGSWLATGGITAPASHPSVPTLIGGRGDGFTHLGQLEVDEVGIWDRALSDAEVAELYNSGAGLTYGDIAGPSPVPVTITDVSPSDGPSVGGTPVQITGVGFQGNDLGAATTVTFDGVSATEIVVEDDELIVCVTPAHAAGAVDVVVTNDTAENDTAAFTYLAPLDVVGVSPSESPAAGGGTVTITGEGFGSTSTVSIGGVPATDVVVVSDTEITCTIPPHVAGLVDVTVSYGGDTATLVDAFKYFDVVGAVASTIVDLLPPGKLWRLELGSKLRLFLFAIGDEFDRVRTRIRDFLAETDPRTADETLPEWEAMLSLPDEQVPTLAATTAGRQFAVTQKYVARGGQSESFFRNLLTACGYDGAGAEIVTFHDRVLRAGFRVNDRVWGDDFCYALQILADPASGDALSSTQLEAVLRKALHSHIVLITEEF